MTQSDIFELLKTDIGMVMIDDTHSTLLNQEISAAISFIRREGVDLEEPYSAEDGDLILMYAAYLHRKRATNEPMPRMLRYALNNRVLWRGDGGCS